MDLISRGFFDTALTMNKKVDKTNGTCCRKELSP
jgi:hypothetical protein